MDFVDPDLPDLLQLEKHIMDRLRAFLQIHKFPLVVLASGRESVAFKFEAVTHALYLESGPAVRDLQRLMQEVLVTTTDMGVEHSLGKANPVPFMQPLPWADVAYIQSGSPFQLQEVHGINSFNCLGGTSHTSPA